MPKVNGIDLISETTERIIRRTLVISAIVLLINRYSVDLGDLKVFGLELPGELFDVIALVLLLWHLYSFAVNWVGDLAAFRLWFSKNDIRTQFDGTRDLDAKWLSGGLSLWKRLYRMKDEVEIPESCAEMERTPELIEEMRAIEKNVELWTRRLDAAGTRFRTLTKYGWFYVVGQSFLLPVGLALWAL